MVATEVTAQQTPELATELPEISYQGDDELPASQTVATSQFDTPLSSLLLQDPKPPVNSPFPEPIPHPADSTTTLDPLSDESRDVSPELGLLT